MQDVKKEQEMNELKKEYHYDAFISYRHTELDKFVAQNLHKRLEAFRMPSVVAKKRAGQKNKIERVFRDKEELPLTSDLNDPIMNALDNSEWLIVICSPRLRESLWCKKEIETFVSKNGRERVLAVLIEGEPAESFPDELLYKTEKRTLADGTIEEIKVPVEPLAADVRGANKKEILKAMDTEVLRILAAMFHLNYDDLRQRHREQKQKKIMRWMTVGAIACLLFAIFCAGVAIKINQKNREISLLTDVVLDQNEQMKEVQAVNLAQDALGYLNEGDREAAIQTAIVASTQYEYLSMPYTPEAQYALAESLGVYNTGEIFKACFQFETMGIITHIDAAPNAKTVILFDDSGTVTLFDVKTREVLLELHKDEHMISAEGGYAFLPDSRLVFLNESSRVCIFNPETKEIDAKLSEEYVFNICSDEQGKYIALYSDSFTYEVYDGETLEYIGSTPYYVDGDDYSTIGPNGIMAYSYFYNGITDSKVHFIDFNNMQELSSVVLENVQIKEIAVNENLAYVRTHHDGTTKAEEKCAVYCIDINTGEVLWENVQFGYTGEFMILPKCEEKEELLVLTDQTARLVDMQTGETGLQISLDSVPVAVYAFNDDNSFEYFCEDGTVVMLTTGINYDLPLTSQFDCKTKENLDYLMLETGIVVLPQLSNQITVYDAVKSEGVVLCEQKEIEAPFCYYDEEAKEVAMEYGLDRAEYVKTLFFDESKQTIYASYWNNEFMIYNCENDAVLALMEDCETMWGYWGTDSEGRIYLQGSSGGYILSHDNRFVMRIPNMVGLDLQQNKVYLRGHLSMYEAPIYSFSQLLNMATSYMDEETKEYVEAMNTDG